MAQIFDIGILCSAYSRGLLVPFIGSGMSTPTCVDWSTLVRNLERQSGIEKGKSRSGDLTQRAFSALQILRRQGTDVSSAISNAVYSVDNEAVPTQATALASIFWPLVCTTNYDDIYFRAKLEQGLSLPRILGRSETDCREVLRHIGFPSSEVVWAVQGLLSPKNEKVQAAIPSDFNPNQFELEIVVGHAEYRKAAHLAPHFRRCFAELFRTRSLFFLGSGLAEPYFLTLFDEIIELTGPPLKPHFAIVEEGKLDPEFLQRQYHIICNTYPEGEHEYVSDFLRKFSDTIDRERVRPSSWGFRIASPRSVETHHAMDHFKIVRATLPDYETLSTHEVVAISCGRKDTGERRGLPLVSNASAAMWKGAKLDYRWLNDWTVSWKNLDQAYGIVARELSVGRSSRDKRTPDAIRIAFLAFLREMDQAGVGLAHVQLLSAGKGKVFQPWISLVQMARAYGQWANEKKCLEPLLRVNVYVFDLGVIAMLQGGYLDLTPPLADSPLHVNVEIIDASGAVNRHHHIVSPTEELRTLVGPLWAGGQPLVQAHPTPALNVESLKFEEVNSQSLREFGLVSGSTLVVDYRTQR